MNKKYIVISYPRSGSTLVTGWIRAMNLKKNRIKKYHRIHTINYPVILFIRNYKECITRHKSQRKPMTKEKFIKAIDGINPVGYMDLLIKFDKYKGDKLLLYYEDFVFDKKKYARIVGEWLGAEPKLLNNVIDNIETISNEELIRYNNKQRSFTKGKYLIFHSNNNDPEINKFADNYIKTKYPDLFEKYLKRYT